MSGECFICPAGTACRQKKKLTALILEQLIRIFAEQESFLPETVRRRASRAPSAKHHSCLEVQPAQSVKQVHLPQRLTPPSVPLVLQESIHRTKTRSAAHFVREVGLLTKINLPAANSAQ
jgi:hypothetical protein